MEAALYLSDPEERAVARGKVQVIDGLVGTHPGQPSRFQLNVRSRAGERYEAAPVEGAGFDSMEQDHLEEPANA